MGYMVSDSIIALEEALEDWADFLIEKYQLSMKQKTDLARRHYRLMERVYKEWDEFRDSF